MRLNEEPVVYRRVAGASEAEQAYVSRGAVPPSQATLPLGLDRPSLYIPRLVNHNTKAPSHIYFIHLVSMKYITPMVHGNKKKRGVVTTAMQASQQASRAEYSCK